MCPIPLRLYLGEGNFDFLTLAENALEILRVEGCTVEVLESVIPGTEQLIEDIYDIDSGEDSSEPMSYTRVEAQYERQTIITFRILSSEELSFKLPFLEGIEFVIAPTVSEAFAVQIRINYDGGFEAHAGIKFKIRFNRDLLIPMQKNTTDDGGIQFEVAPEMGQVEIEVGETSVGFVSGSFQINVEAGFAIEQPVMIGDSGIVLENITGIFFNLEGEGARPEGSSENWRGLYIGEAIVWFPDLLNGSFTVTGLGIGEGGFFGTIRYAASPGLSFDEERKEFTGSDLIGKVLAFAGGINTVMINFTQTIPTSANIMGAIYLPFFDSPINLSIGIDANSGFLLSLLGDDGGPLFVLEKPDFVSLKLDSLNIELLEDVFTVWMNGKIRPLIASIDWPEFEIQRLAINSNGDIDLDGGWVELPETLTLDFHGFKIDVGQMGMGTDEVEAGAPRQWFGFSGGIRLIEGIPLSASVRGLKVSWDPSSPPTSEDPLRGIEVSLEGIGVSMEIPGTLALSGMVHFSTLERPPETLPAGQEEEGANPAANAGLFGHIFSGNVSVNLICLRTQISGELLIGDLTTYHYETDLNNPNQKKLVIGEKFTAFYIVLDAQLPAAIPLGATGTGLYGLTGLFGMHVAPNRDVTGGEEQSWYLWYKQAKSGVEGTAYNVTKVVKWGPYFDHLAFGAGLCLGTIYDDGFTINACALVLVLCPGPIVMIEGRANLLKQRGGDTGRNAEGALYALIVFDGMDETFSMNIDINFSLEDVVTVGGGLEAFFDFNDGERWYIYIGRKEPEEKRIRAEVLSIISASAYFMVDPTAIQFGAKAGIDLQWELGPVEIKLILTLRFEIGVFLKHPQVTGLLELYGEISIKVFGIGIGLILQALLEGSAPQPWWIHGKARVAVNLFFPLPSFDVSVEFTWGESSRPARVELLKGASIIHPKLPSASWPLQSVDEYDGEGPIVPVDAVAVLSCAKPISNVSRRIAEDGTLRLFDYETVEGWEFGYDIVRIELNDLDYPGSIPPYNINATVDTNGVKLPDGEQFVRLGPGATLLPVPQWDTNIEQTIIQEPLVQLWGYGPNERAPMDGRRPSIPPCTNLQPDPPSHCISWQGLPNGTVYPPVFSYRGLSFATPAGKSAAKVNRSSGKTGLMIQELIIRFPEPMTMVYINIDDGTGGRQVEAYYRGNNVEPSPGGTSGLVRGPLDSIRISKADGLPDLLLCEVCYTTVHEQATMVLPGARPVDEADLSVLPRETLLRPNARYELVVEVQQRERQAGQPPFIPHTQIERYRFRTAQAPGLNPTGSDVTADQIVDFRDGPLNRMETYVARTLPANGARVFYQDYGVLVAFNEAYVISLYGDSLSMRFKDRNGKVMQTRAGEPSTWRQITENRIPFVKKGLLDYLGAPRPEECTNEPPVWVKTDQVFLVGQLPDTVRAGRMYTAEVIAGGKEDPLFTFQFSLSRYKNIGKHLKSGLTREGPQLVRTGLPPVRPDEDDWLNWFTEYDQRVEDLRVWREKLKLAAEVGVAATGWRDIRILYENAGKAVSALQAISHHQYETLNAMVQPAFEAVELGHRPLPPQVELVRVHLRLGAGGVWRSILLLESPEPLDWLRLTITYAGGRNARVVWSEDGTRAFIFSNTPDNGMFLPGSYEFTFHYANGGAEAMDLLPVYIDGVLPENPEQITWIVNL